MESDSVSSFIEILECPICCDLFQNATETVCGHCFCDFCLNKCLEKENLCPVCKKSPSPVHPSFTIRRIVDEYRKKKGLTRERIRTNTVKEEKDTGNLFFLKGQYAEAIKHYSNAIDVTPNAMVFCNRATTYFKLKQFLLSLEDCDKALHLDADYSKAHLRKALSLEQLNRLEESRIEFEKTKRLDKSGQFKEEVESGLKRIQLKTRGVQQPQTSSPNFGSGGLDSPFGNLFNGQANNTSGPSCATQ